MTFKEETILKHSKLSDDELLCREFISLDPEKLDHLSPAVPNDFTTAQIEYAFDVTPPKGEDRTRIWCAHCQKKKEWKGYVMKTSNGERYLIGKDCGKKIYGANFNLVEQYFNESRDRKYCLGIFNNSRNNISGLIEALSLWVKDPSIDTYEDIPKRFQSQLPFFYRKLINAIENDDGIMMIIEEVRDFEAEERQQEPPQEIDISNLTTTQMKKLRKAKKLTPPNPTYLYKFIRTPVGKIAGYEMFTATLSPREHFLECIKKLENVKTMIAGKKSDQFSNNELKKIIKTLRDVVKCIEDQHQRLQSPISFFSSKNLSKLADWANKVMDKKFYIERHAFFMEGSPLPVKVNLPADYKLPDFSELSTFSKIIS